MAGEVLLFSAELVENQFADHTQEVGLHAERQRRSLVAAAPLPH
jgi:hypothetical protein